MAKTTKTTINGTEYTLQSVSPSWYFDFNDECNMTGNGKRQTRKYIDGLIKNCVIAPAEVGKDGISHFDEDNDISTPEKLVKAIEQFLRS